MKLLLTILFSLCSTLCFCQGTNIVALRNGSKMVQTPVSYAEVTERNSNIPYSPGVLFDETALPWCSKSTSFPMVFVIELVEEYEINVLEFDTRVEAYEGIASKEVKVEFSSQSSSSGYLLAGDFILTKNKLQSFPVMGKARWIKLSILSNFGNAQYAELAEFKAYGSPSKKLKSQASISGTWKTNWQNIEFNQTGENFDGKYAYGNVKGTVTNGKINRNAIEFDWKEGNLEGTALLYLNEEGDRLSGIWQNSKLETDFGLWTMTRTKPIPLEYEKDNVLKSDSGNASENYFGNNKVVLGENIILKNVLFVRSKAVLLPDSYAELNKLVTTLKSDQVLKIELSGYTDNTGNPEPNIKLSQERVETVKKYFISKGIHQDRINGKGYGPANPIADNSKEETRRLNRRVEFRLSK